MRAHHLNVPSPAASGLLDGGAGKVTWWGFRELSGTGGAAFRLWDGSNTTGRMIAPFSLNPSESVREWPGAHSLPYVTGLYLEVISGSFEGTIQVVNTLEDYGEGMPVVVIGTVDVEVNVP